MSTSRTHRLARARAALRCPTCFGELRGELPNPLRCDRCGTEYPSGPDGQLVLLPAGAEHFGATEYGEGWKAWLRRHPSLFSVVRMVFLPVLRTGPDPAQIILSDEDGLLVDIGAGNDRRGDRLLTVDRLPYPEVDIVADAARLPFADGSLDGVLNVAVLEHLEDPEAFVGEVGRVLRSQGAFVVETPFMQPFHAAPHDYTRWTLPGLTGLLERRGGFVVERAGVAAGPSSAITWMLAEWIAHLLCFGRQRVKNVLSPVLQAVLSPLRFFDALTQRFPSSADMASSFFLVGRRAGDVVSSEGRD